jgi:hypothetical protein
MLDGRRLRVERAKVNRTLFIAKMDKAVSASVNILVIISYNDIILSYDIAIEGNG